MRAFLYCAVAVLAATSLSAQPSITDTRLLSQPALSATHVAFIYAGDLWTSKLDGTDVRHLTTADGDEQSPVFSPNGEMIAFSANYDGNTDVYIIPSAGGTPKRLTYHPDADVVQGFTPDGKAVLFTSGRSSHTNRYTQLFTVPVTGGPDTKLPIPNAARAAYSPDGKHIAYNPISSAFDEWKHYRGGRTSTIWIYDVATHGVEKIPQPEGRSNDVDAQWIGNTVYFRSDRDGEFNVYAYDGASKKVRRLTSHTDFPVLGLASRSNGSSSCCGNERSDCCRPERSEGPACGSLIYEQSGYLHLLDPATPGNGRKLAIGVAAGLRETRPRYVKGDRYVRNVALSPTGVRAAFEYRGEIVTVPVEKGDARNLTNTLGANERSPSWSPDGSQIAYVSDISGEYELKIAPQDGRGAVKTLKLMGHGFYQNLDWSPDGSHIAYVDNSMSTYVIDVKSGAAKLVGSNKVYGVADGNMTHAWSPDSKWLAYTANIKSLVTALSVYNVADDKSYRVTDGLSEVSTPAFDKSGKYLYIFASTDAGPLQDWFSLATADYRRTRSIYAIVLRNDIGNPVAKESDEEKVVITRDSTRRDSTATDSSKGVRLTAPAARGTGATRIDLEGIENRILALPIAANDLTQLATGDAGQIYYLQRTNNQNALHHYDLAKRKDEILVPVVNGYDISADAKKLLYFANDSSSPTPPPRPTSTASSSG